MLFVAPLMVAGALQPLAHRAVAGDGELEFFESKVRPLLAGRCYQCHSAAKGKTHGGLALDSPSGWQKGGESGPAVLPEKPDESLLIQAVRYDDDGPQMPPAEAGGKLSADEIAILTRWVKIGAPDPARSEATGNGHDTGRSSGLVVFSTATYRGAAGGRAYRAVQVRSMHFCNRASNRPASRRCRRQTSGRFYGGPRSI